MEKKDHKFKKIVWSYYKKNKRFMPWREDTSGYSVFVSEIMLQQTQVLRVLEKYPQFMKAFPTFSSLANSNTKKLLSIWQGMGYNRRALYLQKGAQIICKEYYCKLPDDPDELDKLPGIGQATARAMCVFAFNKSFSYIETNIRRIYIHHYFADKVEVPDEDLFPIVERTLDRKSPREWYWALMDYGSYLGNQIDNPNRQSKHYQKQQKFKGSLREVRGKILKMLLKKTYSKEELEQYYNQDKRLFVALSQLEKEGFIKEEEGQYIIA